MIAIDLIKQQTLDADPKAIKQINFTGNLNWAGGATVFFIIEKAKKNCVKFFTRNRKSIICLFCFSIISI